MKKNKMRIWAVLLSLALMIGLISTTVFAAAESITAVGLREYQSVHTAEGGDSEALSCNHEHTDACYTLVLECTHAHTADCYPEGSFDENGVLIENAEPTACTHVCNEEAGCITRELNCQHVHDESCGNVLSISENSVASVDGKGFDTFEEAYAEAAQNAGTIVLLKDIPQIHQGTNACFTIDSTVTVDLNGCSISAWPGGFVFYVVAGGNLTLKGSGDVSGGGSAFGIIYNENGILRMEDGVVLQNNEAGSAWAGAVYNAGEFTMDGGSIQNTSTTFSGGAVYNSGTFTMHNGTISETSATYYGGAVYNGGGTFTMNGGLLDHCGTTNSFGYGGAVYNAGGTMVMSAGTISNCTTALGGGGVHLESGSFTMQNGTIEDCKVISSKYDDSLGGGGVSVQSGAAFTMNDGLIWNNVSSDGDGGGGVTNAGSFTMTGGRIIMNDTTDSYGTGNNGGGVNNAGTMTMSGGMIAKNNGIGGVYSGNADSRLVMTGGAVFENSSLQIFGTNVPEESKKVDIVLHAGHQGNEAVNVCKASDMTADGYIFTAWKYIGEGWRFATSYDGQDIEGPLVPPDSELLFTNMSLDRIFFRAVSTSPEGEEKEGIYLNGTLGDDGNDGTNNENAVRTFEKAWQLANDQLNEKEEEPVTIYVCGEVRVSDTETWGEGSAKNIVVMRADGYPGELAKVVSGGALTLQNITIDGNGDGETDYSDSLIHVMGGGKLLIQEGAVLQNNFAGRETKCYDGGAVYIENGTAEMTGGVIQNNRARNNGGGVSIDHGAFKMSGGTIVENTAKYGGGICVVRGGHAEITGDALISKNSASDGGSVNLGAYTTAEAYYNGEKQTLEMTGGTISANSASNNGGGIYIQSHSTAVISKGDIVENLITGGSSFRYRGAGIYVNGGKYNGFDGEAVPNGLLQLYNAEIAYNIANEFGGGLAACPTANVKLYVTDGAVFHDNQLDTKSALDIYIAKNKKEDSTSYVSDFMLGGGMYQWLWGDSAEGIRAEQSQYQNTAEEVLLSGLCDAADVEKAANLATVHITGNQARNGSGGAIATNGDVIIGTPDPSKTEADITISKLWEDDNNKYNSRPDKIELDIQYGEYTLRGIELTKETSWTTTLHNMPNKILQQQNPSVTVLEYGGGNYRLGEVKADIQENTLTISIENQYTHPTGNLTVLKIVSGSNASSTKDFTFTVTLDDDTVNGTCGDMVFENGVANFTLKADESKTASNLPAGVTYKVVEQEANTDGYTTSSVGETGTVQANKTAEVIFNNHKDGSGGGGPGDSYTSVSVKKVWKLDDGGAAADFVTVNLLRNGTVYATVKLDGSNDWSYSWSHLDDSYIWTLEEANVSDRFTVTIDRDSENHFTITNDDNPSGSDTPDNPDTPDTPDEPDNPSAPEEPGLLQTGQLWRPVVLALVLGFALLAIGVLDMRRHRYHGKHEK